MTNCNRRSKGKEIRARDRGEGFLSFPPRALRAQIVPSPLTPATQAKINLYHCICKTLKSEILVKKYIFPTVKSAFLLLFYIFAYC